MSRRRPPVDEPSPGVFKYVMAGGIVVSALLLWASTRKDDAPAPPPSTAAPVAAATSRPIPGKAERPAYFDQITRLTAQLSSSPDSTAGRDALFARAKVYAENKAYHNASEDLRRLLRRRDIDDAIKQEAQALLRQVEAQKNLPRR